MKLDTQVLRPKVSVRVLFVALYLAGVVMLTIHLPFNIADRHRVWIVPCFAFLGAFAVDEVFVTRIVLGSDSIRIVSLLYFMSRTIPRSEVDSVSGKERGVSLLLRNGEVIRLAGAGHSAQGLTNTIRAWIRRSEVQS
jgi:hypothetical protein